MEVGIIGDRTYMWLQSNRKSGINSKIFELLDRVSAKGADTIYTTLDMGIDRLALRAAKNKGFNVVAFSEIYCELSKVDIIIVGNELELVNFIDYLIVIDTGNFCPRIDKYMQAKKDNIVYVNYITGEESFGRYTDIKTRQWGWSN